MFEKYNKYKNSWLLWLWNMPYNWELSRAKDIATVNGRVWWKALKASEYVKKSNYIFLATPNIKNDDIDFKNVDYITKARYDESPEIMLKEGDIVLTKDGSTLWTVNIVKELPTFTTVNSSIAVIRFKGVNPRFMLYQLKSEYLQNIIKLKKDWAWVPHLFQRDINNFDILLPSVDIQNTIVNFLDKKVTNIDLSIKLLNSKKNYYLELKQKLIYDCITKWLNSNVKLINSEINWVWNYPNNWTKARLKNIFNERVSRNKDKKSWEPITKNILSVMKDVWVINHKDKWLVWNKMSEDITWYKLVYPDDIVVNKMNVIIGSVGISKEFWALSVIYIILITRLWFSPRYYDYVFRVKAFQKSLRQIATWILEIREAVNMTLFMWLELPVPPESEQIEIANYLDEKTEKIDEIVKTIDKNIDKLKEYRKVLINDTVTGKIKVI